MNKPLSKNLQNIERNKTLKFGVYKCCWSGEKTQTSFKYMHFRHVLSNKMLYKSVGMKYEQTPQ